MKKLILAVLMFVMIAMPVIAAPNAGDYGSVPYTTDEIEIDGVKDEIYEQALVFDVDGALSATITATGTAYMLYTDGYVYLYVEIADDPYFMPADDALISTSPWTPDNVEFLIDTTGKMSATDIAQFRVGAMGQLSGQNGDGSTKAYGTKEVEKIDMFEGAKGDFKGGYAVEFKVPYEGPETMSFNVMISDVPKEGAAQQNTTCYSEVAKKGSGAWDATQYVNVTLDGEEVTAIVEEEAAPAGSAATSDASVVLFAALAVISLAGFTVAKRVK